MERTRHSTQATFVVDAPAGRLGVVFVPAAADAADDGGGDQRGGGRAVDDGSTTDERVARAVARVAAARGYGHAVSAVRGSSPLRCYGAKRGHCVAPGDVVVAVDGEDTAALDHDEIATYLKSLMAAPRSLTIARPAEHALPGGVGDMLERERGEVELEREARAADARAAADGNFIPARTYVRPGGAPAPSVLRGLPAAPAPAVGAKPKPATSSRGSSFEMTNPLTAGALSPPPPSALTSPKSPRRKPSAERPFLLDPYLLDDIGFMRVTVLKPYGWRTKALTTVRNRYVRPLLNLSLPTFVACALFRSWSASVVFLSASSTEFCREYLRFPLLGKSIRRGERSKSLMKRRAI